MHTICNCMKILVVDPWGIKTLSPYANGFYYGLSASCTLSVASNYYFENKTSGKYQIIRVFFKKSEKMKDGVLRSIVRGIEYVNAYKKIIKLVKKEKYEYVEIEWCLMYKLDRLFLKIIKKYSQVIYKAHNVIPHEHGEKKIPDLSSIYSIADYIIFHGIKIKDEFSSLFPSICKEKVIIQPFGTFDINTSFDEGIVPEIIRNKIAAFATIYIFFGGLFYNKGVDRLVDSWVKGDNHNSLLIIAGKASSDYYEYKNQKDLICSTNNILLLDEFVCDNTLSYLITKSDAVIIPYRHASMSGVLFTSSAFSKPVLCTNVGSLCEYFVDKVHGFLVSNDVSGIDIGIKTLQSTDKNELKKMGIAFHNYVADHYSWVKIGESLVEELIKRQESNKQ